MPTPRCLAMVLCDSVHQDAGSRKWSILGTFDAVNATKFPAALSLGVYFVLTECDPTVELQLRVTRADDAFSDSEVFAVGVTVSGARDHIDVTQSGVRIQGVVNEAGVYFIELRHSDDKLMERRLVVNGPPPSAPEQTT